MEQDILGVGVADDILRGAGAIAPFLFGSERDRRRVYYLVETDQLPSFRIGKGSLCARRSTLMDWIKAQEGSAS